MNKEKIKSVTTLIEEYEKKKQKYENFCKKQEEQLNKEWELINKRVDEEAKENKARLALLIKVKKTKK